MSGDGLENLKLAKVLRALVETATEHQKAQQAATRPYVEEVTRRAQEFAAETAMEFSGLAESLSDGMGKLFEDGGPLAGRSPFGRRQAESDDADVDPLKNMFRADVEPPEPAKPETNSPEAVAGLMALREEARAGTGMPPAATDLELALVLRQRRTGREKQGEQDS